MSIIGKELFAKFITSPGSKDLVNKLQRIQEGEKLEKIFMIAWNLWKRQNRNVLDNELTHPDPAADQALSLLVDFKTQLVTQVKM